MKKVYLITLIIIGTLSLNAYAIDFKIFDVRNKIFMQSKEIKTTMPTSKDVVLLTSMFDTCIITMMRLDAYFYMIGLFDAVKNSEQVTSSADILINWLNDTKKANDLNLKTLKDISSRVDDITKVHLDKLTTYFNELNVRIDEELKKVSAIKQVLKLTPKK